MVRPLENWIEIIEDLGDIEAAEFLLKDLIHYRMDGTHEKDDIEQVMTFMTAYQISRNKEGF